MMSDPPVLRIDSEFESIIPPLDEEEFRQLADNILRDGEISDHFNNSWKVDDSDDNNPWISAKGFEKWNEYMKDILIMELDPVTGAQPMLSKVFSFK